MLDLKIGERDHSGHGNELITLIMLIFKEAGTTANSFSDQEDVDGDSGNQLIKFDTAALKANTEYILN